MTTVLALRALGLGDTYAAVPALRGIRAALPGARITLAGPPAWGTLLIEHGIIDAVLPAAGLEPVSWQGPPPTVAVNLHGRGPQSHRLLQALRPRRLVGFACPAAGFEEGPRWDAQEHEVLRWMRLVDSMGGSSSPADLRVPQPAGAAPHRGAVVLHPGAASGSRRWPVDRWCVVARALVEEGRAVVATGTAGEVRLTRALTSAVPAVTDLGGRLTARELAQLVAAAGLLVSGDTGVAHLATAYGTPSVILFGPTAPSRWGPLVDKDIHRVIWLPVPGDPPGDPHADPVDPRLARIRPSDVLAEVRTALRSSAAGRGTTRRSAPTLRTTAPPAPSRAAPAPASCRAGAPAGRPPGAAPR